MSLGKVIMPMLCVAALGACETMQGVNGNGAANKGGIVATGTLTSMLDDVKSDRLNDPFIRKGVEALEGGDYLSASKAFNRALKFDPANANLHFLNALSYHLLAEAGDGSQYNMAKVGYDLALRYDSGNDWAAYLMGHILMREQRYREAQDAFALALLNAPQKVTYLKSLATASYYGQDIEASLSAIDKAVALAPEDKDALYNQVLIKAAAGDFNQAEKLNAVYSEGLGKKVTFRSANLTRRLSDWRRFYETKPYLQQAQSSTSEIFGSAPKLKTVSPAPNLNNGFKDGAKDREAIPDHMAMVDVVIIRSEERVTTNKGVNLLNGLSATLSGTVFGYSDVRYLKGQSTARATTLTTSPTLALATVTYSLNIFNDNNDRNEVLARPTLVALDGKKSEFFSGAVWHIALNGASGSEGNVSEVPVGIRLQVTPHFKSADELEIKVAASRAFIESLSSSASFQTTPAAQTTKTQVTANVTLKFGETLVLSGLSEKETEKLRDGVPLLQDIPVIQYLFSNEATLDFTKSVLILLTPRKPKLTYADGTAKFDPSNPPDKAAMQPNLTELKGRADWFKPASNLDAVFHHIKDGTYYKEFRSGDVTTEKWAEPDRLKRMTQRVLGFLYY